MSWDRVELTDKGAGRLGSTSCEILHKARGEARRDPEGKVTVAETLDGTLLIRCTTTHSQEAGHYDLLTYLELTTCRWCGGAFYRVNWEKKTVEIFGTSESLGPLPESASVLAAVQTGLQNLLNEFLTAGQP